MESRGALVCNADKNFLRYPKEKRKTRMESLGLHETIFGKRASAIRFSGSLSFSLGRQTEALFGRRNEMWTPSIMPALLTLLIFQFALGMVVSATTALAETSEETRANIRGQLEYIAKGVHDSKHRMRARYGVIEGNIQRGNWGWACNSDGRIAERIAEANCQKNGGGCERLYSVYIHNDTPHTIRIHLFHPWESDFSTANALFQWTWVPGEGANLGLANAGLLLAPTRFYLRAEYSDGSSRVWGPKRISEFNHAVRNYRDGQNIRIRLVP
jgi:hypothetical protein